MSRLDPEQARRFLQTIHGSFFSQGKGFLEVRYKPEGGDIQRRFYPGIEPLIKDIPKWNPDCNCWVGVAPRSNNRSGKKGDCTALSAAFADVDVGVAGHKGITKYQTKEEALAAIEAFPLRPSIVIDSGGGYQPYWLFDAPVILNNGNLSHLERINKGLALALGGDVGATDAARILRLPGTFNMKLNGNPRPVKIVWCEPERVYTLAELARYEFKPQTQSQQSMHPAGEYEAYAQKALADEIAKLARTPANNPGRNNQLNKSAKALGELIGAGVLDRGSVEAALYGVAVSIGLGEVETRATIRSGIEAGIKEPRKLPEWERVPGSAPKPEVNRPKVENPKPPQAAASPAKTTPVIRFVSGRELQSIEFKDPAWVVPGILPEGLCLLSARPKKGKTWIALNISVAKSTGGCALGKSDLRVTQGKVLYLCLEDKLRRAQKRLNIILKDAQFPEDLILAETWPRLDKGGLEALQDFLKEHSDCKMVVIDSFVKIKPPRPKNVDPYDFDMMVGGALQSLAQERQICLLLIYHNRKTEGEDPLDDVIGSTGLTGAVDAVLVLRRGRGQTDGTLFITGRDVEELELALKFHPGEGLWELLGDAAEYAKSQERIEIINLLREYGPKTPKEVAETINKKHSNIKALLWKMVKDGEVKSVGGKYEAI